MAGPYDSVIPGDYNDPNRDDGYNYDSFTEVGD